MNAIKKNKFQPSILIIHIFIFGNLLIISNYISYFLNFIFFQKIIIFFLLLTFFYQLLFFKDTIKYLIPLKILIFLLIVFSILKSTLDWDALNIWLFHAKKIFYSKNLLEISNYFPSSHNDYPLILPSLQASLNSYFIEINYSDIKAEIFFSPKLAIQANLFFLIFPLFYICSFIKDNINLWLFIILLIFIAEKLILSGSVDFILGLYFVATFISLFRYFMQNKIYKYNQEFFLCFLNVIILTNLKNEGLALFLTLYFSLFLTSYLFKDKSNNEKKIVILLALLPILLWKYFCLKNNVTSDILNENTISYMFNNFFSLRNYWMIFNEIFLNKSILLPLILLIVLIFKNMIIIRSNNFFKVHFNIKQIYIFALCASIFYLMILFSIYFSTPHSLEWHLQTSAYRTVLPLGLLFLVIVFYKDESSSKYLFKR